jgi:hypothetical protein
MDVLLGSTATFAVLTVFLIQRDFFIQPSHKSEEQMDFSTEIHQPLLWRQTIEWSMRGLRCMSETFVILGHNAI